MEPPRTVPHGSTAGGTGTRMTDYLISTTVVFVLALVVVSGVVVTILNNNEKK